MKRLPPCPSIGSRNGSPSWICRLSASGPRANRINPINRRLILRWRGSPQLVTGCEAVAADPENMNNDRAEYAAAALRHFQCTTGSDYDDSLTDLLGDLMHWSDRNGVDFSAELERARGHYGAETTPTTEQAIKEPGARETADTGEAQHSRWTGEPLGEGAAAGPTQSKGQSH